MSQNLNTVTISTSEYIELTNKSEMYRKALANEAFKVRIVGVSYKKDTKKFVELSDFKEIVDPINASLFKRIEMVNCVYEKTIFNNKKEIITLKKELAELKRTKSFWSIFKRKSNVN